MKKVVMGLSGGMDSTTLLAILLDDGYDVHCCSFTYGSKHNAYEGKAAENIIKYYKEQGLPVTHYQIDLTGAFTHFQSDLLKTGGAIPEGHYDGENMRSTVVPGRNMIMASIMAGLAESIGAESIALGVHAGDHHIYPDCRKEFIKAFDSAVYLSSDRKVSVLTPLIDDDKASILIKGFNIETEDTLVPYDLTRTCYADQELSCGKCGSCIERILAFNAVGWCDPIDYELCWGDVLENALKLNSEK